MEIKTVDDSRLEVVQGSSLPTPRMKNALMCDVSKVRLDVKERVVHNVDKHEELENGYVDENNVLQEGSQGHYCDIHSMEQMDGAAVESIEYEHLEDCGYRDEKHVHEDKSEMMDTCNRGEKSV